MLRARCGAVGCAEAGEQVCHGGGVVGGGARGAHLEGAVDDPQPVAHLCQRGLHGGDVVGQGAQTCTRAIGVEVGAPSQQCPRPQWQSRGRGVQCVHRGQVLGGGVEVQAMALMRVVQLARDAQPAPHPPHVDHEFLCGGACFGVVEVGEHVLAESDGVGVADRAAQQGGEVVVVDLADDRGDQRFDFQVGQRLVADLDGRDALGRHRPQHADGLHSPPTSRAGRIGERPGRGLFGQASDITYRPSSNRAAGPGGRSELYSQLYS